MSFPTLPSVLQSALALSLLAGCTTTKAPEARIALPEKFTTGSVRPMTEGVNALAWWQGFGDDTLSALVRLGLEENLSLRQAGERLDIARIRAVASGAAWMPGLTASAQAGRYGSGRTDDVAVGNNAGAGLQFSWLIDLFGRRKMTRQAAFAEQQAAVADVEAVRLAYVTDIVSTYIDLQYYRRAIAISGENLASYRNTLALTQTMRDSGVASNLDIAQAQALVDAAAAEMPALQIQLHRSANHLATLLGRTATDFLKTVPGKGGQPRLTRPLDVGIPADLLRNRPDIRREERLLAASAARIGIAESQLYPSLSLTGNIDVTRILASGLTSTGVAWSFGPALIAPILDGGRLRAEVDVAAARSRIQYLRWRENVLRAVEEVENALVAVHRGNAETAALNRKVSSSRRALKLARDSYAGGASVVLDVLEANRSLGSARLDLAQSQRGTAIAYVSLYVAVGGGAAVLPVQGPSRDI
ncbi:efflux transporter outer membrane subunit [Rhizobium halophytocola]|uniref:Multidrug efflux system outer membrane protein n=1 Tax=Rhizobium halophytocola TaxID=735519 RepID=A0ABS4DVK9_9HYPH|nr:efflux transporter outer membrane subunit [Rhizobium halophytocola]MBP1849715.1 multidrug efflux system outer membrane protein [Rhizobium halophytocola]